jgi:hypothetical protein
MLAAADVVDLVAEELAGLRGGPFAFPPSAASPVNRPPLRHDHPL